MGQIGPRGASELGHPWADESGIHGETYNPTA